MELFFAGTNTRMQATQHTNLEQLRTTTHREDEKHTLHTLERPQQQLFDRKDDRKPLNSGRDGPDGGERNGHNSTHTIDTTNPSQPTEREQKDGHNSMTFARDRKIGDSISASNFENRQNCKGCKRHRQQEAEEVPEAQGRQRIGGDVGMEIAMSGNQRRRKMELERLENEDLHYEKRQRKKKEPDRRGEGDRRLDEISSHREEYQRTGPAHGGIRRGVGGQPEKPVEHAIAENRKFDDHGNLGNSDIESVPLYSAQEVAAISTELKSAVVDPHNIQNRWIGILSAPDSQRSIAMALEVEVPTALQTFASQWNSTRNMSFWAYIRALLERGVTGEVITNIIESYIRGNSTPQNFSIHAPEALERLALVHSLALAHTQQWPRMNYEGEEHTLVSNRAELFTTGIIEILKIKGRFPSMETDEIERVYKGQIRAEMEQRWSAIQEQARSFVVGPITGQVIYDIALSELLKQDTFQFGNMLAPITIEGHTLRIELHEWDPCIANKLYPITRWRANNRKSHIKRKQLHEEMRKLRLFHKVIAPRSQNPEPRELSTEEARARIDLLQTGLDKSGNDAITLDTPPPRIIEMALTQWEEDRNFTFFYNMKIRRFEWKLSPDQVISAFREYKKQAAQLRGNERRIIAPDIITAMMITHPSNWPTMGEEERVYKMQDPEFRRSVERFGWPCTELTGIFGCYPEWKTGIPDPENEARLREYYAERERQAAAHMGLPTSTDYHLWTFILSTLFDNATPTPDQIYNIPEGVELTMVPRSNLHTTREEDQRQERREEEQRQREEEQRQREEEEQRQRQREEEEQRQRQREEEQRRRHKEEQETREEGGRHEPERPDPWQQGRAEEEVQESDFARRLRQILMEPEIETVQVQLQALIEEPRALGYTPISLDTTSIEYVCLCL